MSENSASASAESAVKDRRSSPETHAENSPSLQMSGKARREEERRRRIEGHLTDISLDEISVYKRGKVEYYLPNTIYCIRGSYSQFSVLDQRSKPLLPPLTSDCCQTFSTVAAVVLSSFGFAVLMQECSNASTVNYLLYISAWLHQLSAPAWPQQKVRPTISDLNTCLRLPEFFPSRIDSSEFEVVFYNQPDRAKSLVDRLCSRHVKRDHKAMELNPVCGYVIATGDYTVSILSLPHDIKNIADNRYSEAWSLFLCDSHGTQPWSDGKACLTGINIGVPRPGAEPASGIVLKEEGLRHFSTVLFALLEDHRSMSHNPQQTPYMTWSPVRRGKGTALTAQEIRTVIDEVWIPSLMSSANIAREASKYGFTPEKCFMGRFGTTRPRPSKSQ